MRIPNEAGKGPDEQGTREPLPQLSEPVKAEPDIHAIHDHSPLIWTVTMVLIWPIY